MPVSKKTKYKPIQFTHTDGYKFNSHRDKYGKTQQERVKEQQHKPIEQKSMVEVIKDYLA